MSMCRLLWACVALVLMHRCLTVNAEHSPPNSMSNKQVVVSFKQSVLAPPTTALISTADGNIHAVDLLTGRVKWSVYAGSPSIKSYHAKNNSARDAVYIPSLDGSIVAFTHDDGFRLVPASVRDIVNKAPFSSDHNVHYVGDKRTKLYAVDMETGTLKHASGAYVPTNLDEACPSTSEEGEVEDPSTLWFGVSEYLLSAVDKRRGTQKWNMSYAEVSSLSVDEEQDLQLHEMPLQLGSSPDGTLYAWDTIGKTVLWTLRLGSPVMSGHLVNNRRLQRFPFLEQNPTVTALNPSRLHVSHIEGQLFAQWFVPMPFLANPSSALAAAPTDAPSPLHCNPSAVSFPFCLEGLYLPRKIDMKSLHLLPKPLEEKVSPAVIHPPQLPAPTPLVGPSIVGPTQLLPTNHLAVAGLAVTVTGLTVVFAIRKWFNPKKKGNKKKNKSSNKTSASNGKETQVGKLRLRVGSVLGYGSHGTVVLDGCWEKRPVAVKRLVSQFFEQSAQREIELLIELDGHPNVVRYFAREADGEFIYLALEKCVGSLEGVVLHRQQQEKKQVLNEAESGYSTFGFYLDTPSLVTEDLMPTEFALQLLRDIISGLQYLHDQNIVHRDIKPHNILLTSSLVAKISDMGLGKRLEDDQSSFATHMSGSTGWQAVEVINGSRKTRSVDIFSLGCVFFYILTQGGHPFGERVEREKNILKGKFNLQPLQHIPEAVDLIRSMIQADPNLRPSAAEVAAHPLLWSEEKKLAFLQDVSDRIEDEDIHGPLLQSLEEQAADILGPNWGRVLHSSLIDNLGKYRKYNYGSVRDCLRVIRNKKNHYRELPAELKAVLGPVPDGFYRYFAKRFPRLLLHAYEFVRRHCSEERCFRLYFSKMATGTATHK